MVVASEATMLSVMLAPSANESSAVTTGDSKGDDGEEEANDDGVENGEEVARMVVDKASPEGLEETKKPGP